MEQQPAPTQSDRTLSYEEKLGWLRLARTENVGPITFYNFIDYYGSADRALDAIPELAARGGRKKPLRVPPLAEVEKEYKTLLKHGADIICACEPEYPLALAALEDAPPVISMRGNPALMARHCIAIVGARNASHNGRRFAEKLAHDLGAAGQVVVSGMARGIDTAAHMGALTTGTIAVVAGGIDVVYPPENQKLYDDICAHGLVIAESPLGQKPFARSFPRRNRIVSGLCAGVIVVEANMRSGSLITARLAGEQGRDLFAVPGHPADPRAQGANHLIREGAILIRGAEDVLEALQGFGGNAPRGLGLGDSGFARFEPAPFNPDAHPDAQDFDAARQTVLDSLSFTPSDINEIIRESGLTAALIQTVMMELELAGTVQRLPGNRAVLIQE